MALPDSNSGSESLPPSQNKRSVIIIGAGQAGRELARTLSNRWEITVLDLDESRLERLRKELPNRNIRLLAKDGTSRLNLKEAGLDDAEWLAALTNKDATNAEACQIARASATPPTTIAIMRRPEHQAWFEDSDTEVVSRPEAVARLVMNRMERAHQVASGVGIGEGEILEIPILKSSPAIDTRVRDLRANRWLIAAIYRENQYVVPHGEVVIREGDRILLTGDPEILPSTADYLRAGVARFPLQYGTNAIGFAPNDTPEIYWDEFQYLIKSIRTQHALLLTQDHNLPPNIQLTNITLEHQTLTKNDGLTEIVTKDFVSKDCGCLILHKDKQTLLNRIGFSRPHFAYALDTISCPMLLAAGTHPYRRILLPILEPEASVLAAELAIDLSRQLNIEIVAVTVRSPTFLVGEDEQKKQQNTLETIVNIGELYHIKIEQVIMEGNPAKQIGTLSENNDLLVIAHRSGRKNSFFNPDPVLQIIMRAHCSVLAVSYRDRMHGTN